MWCDLYLKIHRGITTCVWMQCKSPVDLHTCANIYLSIPISVYLSLHLPTYLPTYHHLWLQWNVSSPLCIPLLRNGLYLKTWIQTIWAKRQGTHLYISLFLKCSILSQLHYKLLCTFNQWKCLMVAICLCVASFCWQRDSTILLGGFIQCRKVFHNVLT
jgi:hypothetical protein